MNKLIFFFFPLSFFLNVSFAQPGQIEFVTYKTTDGMYEDWNILSMVQDRQGYLWLCSVTGLEKFDGYTFQSYRLNLKDSTSPGLLFPRSLLIDRDSVLWVTGFSGSENKVTLSRYNIKTDNFTNFYYNTTAVQGKINTGAVQGEILGIQSALFQDKTGNIWLNTNEGLLCFDPQAERFTDEHPYKELFESLTGKYVVTVLQDSRQNIWIATFGNGLYRYISGQERLETFKSKPGFQKGLQSDRITCLYEDTSGVIFIGTEKSALHFYDYESNLIHRLPEAEGRFKNVSPLISAGPSHGGDGNINIIKRLTDGSFWIGTANGGIKVYTHDFSQSREYTHDPFDSRSLSTDIVGSLFEDNQGNIWIGTINRGIMKVVPSQLLFKPQGNDLAPFADADLKNVNSLLESRDGSIWAGTVAGVIVKYNRRTNEQRKFRFDPLKADLGAGPTGFDIDAILEDLDGRIWLATINGLNEYDQAKNIFKKIPLVINGKADNSAYDIQTIAEDSDGLHLWLGTWGKGLFKFNKKTYETERITGPDDDVIICLKNMMNNDLCIGTGQGLYIMARSTGVLRKYLAGQEINSVYEELPGILWISCREGLYKLDVKNNEFTTYTTQNGLPTNWTGSILKDDKGFLWIATNEALARFDPSKETFHIYDETDGALKEYFCGGNNAYLKTSDGLMLFGGLQGITVFDPAKIKDNICPPEVRISDVQISDNQNNVTFIRKNSDADSLFLKYTENEIVFNYVGIHFKRPAKNVYKYILEPYDNDWKDAGTLRSVRYTSLNPGRYTFKVKAANSDAVWSPLAAEMQLIILPPWWVTWWAYSLYVLGGLGLLLFVRRFELRRRLLQAENKRKSEELEEARQLQLSMLPKELPQLPHLDIAVYMQTATEVGGDYYDFHVTMDGTLTVVIGDATGHGMKAGTMVTTAKSLFKTHAANPDILFSFQEFSRCIKEMNFGRIAMCLTMLKINDHTIQIGTAGMPPSYIYRSKTKDVEEYQFEAMPLGAMNQFPYKVKESQLYQGDTVLLLSDGMPELKNKNNEMFGYSRIKEVFANIAEKSPDDIISHLKNAGASWANNGEPDDDVTFVVIKVK